MQLIKCFVLLTLVCLPGALASADYFTNKVVAMRNRLSLVAPTESSAVRAIAERYNYVLRKGPFVNNGLIIEGVSGSGKTFLALTLARIINPDMPPLMIWGEKMVNALSVNQYLLPPAGIDTRDKKGEFRKSEFEKWLDPEHYSGRSLRVILLDEPGLMHPDALEKLAEVLIEGYFIAHDEHREAYRVEVNNVIVVITGAIGQWHLLAPEGSYTQKLLTRLGPPIYLSKGCRWALRPQEQQISRF